MSFRPQKNTADLFKQVLSRLGLWSFDHAWLSLVIILLSLGGAGFGLTKITTDMSQQAGLKPGDVIRKNYDSFRQRFQVNDTIILAVPVEKGVSHALLQQIHELQQQIETSVAHVKKITSVINVRYTHGVDDELIVEDLLENWPNYHWGMDDLQQFLVTAPSYKNRLISADGRYLGVIIELNAFDISKSEGVSNTQDFLKQQQLEEVVKQLHTVLADFEQLNIAVTGNPVVIEALNRKSIEGSLHGSIMSGVGIFLVLLYFFRRLSAVMLPLIIIQVAITFALGLMGYIGSPFTMSSNNLLPLIFAIGSADAVHILALFYRRYDANAKFLDKTDYKLSRRQSLREALEHSALPVLMTSITTAAGFISFTNSELTTISDLGVYSAVAVLVAFMATVVVIPVAVALLPIKPSMRTDQANRHLDKVFNVCTGFALKCHKSIVIAACILLLGSLAIASQFRFSSDFISYFPSQDVVVNDIKTIDKAFHGVTAIEMVIDSGRARGILDRGFLERLQQLEQHYGMTEVQAVRMGKVYSILNILKETHKALMGNDKKSYRLAESSELIAQELLLFEMNNTDDLLEVTDSDYRIARMTFMAEYVDTVDLLPLIEDMRQQAAGLFDEQVTIQVTGNASIAADTVPMSLQSMMGSYIIALIVVSLCMVFIVGDIRIGLLAMLPNVLPISLTMAFMVLMDWPFDQTTAMVGAIALGIVVDDTLHFMSQFRNYWQDNPHKSIAWSVRQTFDTTGRALMITTILLCTVFFGNTFPELLNVKMFSFLLLQVTVLALFCDFIIAPALIFWLFHTKNAQDLKNTDKSLDRAILKGT